MQGRGDGKCLQRLYLGCMSDHADVPLFPVRYTAADLRKAPEEEAVFFLRCGQFHNDVTVFLRQALQSFAEDDDPEPLKLAAVLAVHTNVRFLAARLSEGWKMVDGHFQQVFTSYGEAIPQTVQSDFKKLRQYFGKDCLVRNLRNNIASHYDHNMIREAYRALGAEEPMIDYLAETEGNSLFFSAEIATLASLNQLVGADEVTKAIATIRAEVMKVARWFQDVIWAYMKASWSAT